MVQISQAIEDLVPVRRIGEEEEELIPTRRTGGVGELTPARKIGAAEPAPSPDFGLSKVTSIAPAKRRVTPPPLSSEYWRGISKKIESIPRQVVKGVKKIPEIGPAVAELVESAGTYVAEHPTVTGWELVKAASPIVKQVTEETAKSVFETVTHPFETLYHDPVRFAADAAIVFSGGIWAVGKGMTLAPKVSAAFKRINALKKVGKPPLEIDLKTVAQSMVDDAGKYQDSLEKILITSGRKAEDVKTWREMAIKRVPQKPSITEVPKIDKPTPVVPAGKKPTTLADIKKKHKTVEEVVKEPVAPAVPTAPEQLSIPTSAMGMSLDEFEAARISGELITSIPRNYQTKMYTAGGDLKEAISDLVAPKIQRNARILKEMFHSPDVVLSKSIQTAENYTLMDTANLGKLRWLNAHTERAEAARQFIKKGSPLDYSISKLRNKRVGVSDALKMSDDELVNLGLSKAEISDIRAYPDFAKKFDDYLDKTFDVMLRQWGASKVAMADENRIWALANDARAGKKVSPKTIKGLAPEQQDVFNIYKHRIPKYITRLFPKKDALDFLQQEMANIESMIRKIKPTSKRHKYWVDRKQEVVDSLGKIKSTPNPLDALGPEAKAAYERMYGGEPVFFDHLPRRVSNKFFQRRLGKEGYDPSTIKSFYTYMTWMGKKIFDEPVIKYIHRNWDKVPMDLREYMKWYVQDYMGYIRNPLENLYGAVKSLMWTKALGFNPRSAIVNMTQRINILADANPLDVAKAYAKGFTDEGKRMFKASGLGQTVPTVLMEGGEIGARGPLEGLRNLAGWMFSKIEEGNLKLAFLTGAEGTMRKGKTMQEAMLAGVKLAEKTQFRYGKIGTPRVLRGGGGVVMQFWSYPIKQLEFLTKLYREDKRRFIAWLALSEGTNQTLQNFLDTDLSNALGVGMNWGEMLEGIDALGEGDIGEFFYRLTKRGGLVSGGGILPYGLGPGVEFGPNVAAASSKLLQAILGQEAWSEAFGSVSLAIEPGASRRTRQAIRAIAEGPSEEGLYPIRRIGGGYLQYEEPLVDVVKRTLVGRPMIETKQSRELKAKLADQKALTSVNSRIADLLVMGKDKEAERISKSWGGIWPSKDAIKAAYKRYLGTRPKDTKALRRFRNLFLEENK